MQLFAMILSNASRQEWASEVARAAGVASPLVMVASPAEAAKYLAEKNLSPSHVVLDVGARGRDILEEIDLLAQQCVSGTRVIAVGDTNDIQLYREILRRGVLDYLPMPANPGDLVRTLTVVAASAPTASSAPAPATYHNQTTPRRVIAFMSAASGDGASMAAMNTAYAISELVGGKTVLVDMDYQFGMVAKQLALQSQYGIRDVFDHPERGVDSMLIKRMAATYQQLDVITAPNELRYLPNVSAEAILDLVGTLKENYENVIIDLPHVWTPWVASVTQQATHIVLVAQLWLKSVSHASRLMRGLREMGVPLERVIPVINRSGAKFKEAIEPKDFERVCNAYIRYRLANDIKTVTTAEASAKTVVELEASALASDINKLARGLIGQTQEGSGSEKRVGLFSKFKG